MGIKVKIVLVKVYNFIGKVERYYAIIRQAYLIITAEI